MAQNCNIIMYQGFFVQKDYKMFPPSVNWDNIDWSSRRPQMDFPVQVFPFSKFWWKKNKILNILEASHIHLHCHILP